MQYVYVNQVWNWDATTVTVGSSLKLGYQCMRPLWDCVVKRTYYVSQLEEHLMQMQIDVG